MSKKKNRNSDPIPIPVGYEFIVKTDGACAGNPGTMGIGGVIYKEDNFKESFSETLSKGSNNEAEYSAVINGLELIKKYNPSSVLFCADSQLVMYQILGYYSVNDGRISKLYSKVQKLVRELNKNCKKVDFLWIRRTQNEEADALASKAADMAQAVVNSDGKVEFWTKDEIYIPNLDEINDLPQPHESCGLVIELLNSKEDTKFKDFISLKTHGIDKYSRMKIERMLEIIALRFGPATVEWLKKTIGEEETDYNKQVLKWVARGLNPDKALKKVSVDKELAANFLNKKS